jgi:hypothetical protein
MTWPAFAHSTRHIVKAACCCSSAFPGCFRRPFSWVIKTFRASLFGAYDNGWLRAWVDVILSDVLALLLASCVSRCKTVPAADYRLGIEV